MLAELGDEDSVAAADSSLFWLDHRVDVEQVMGLRPGWRAEVARAVWYALIKGFTRKHFAGARWWQERQADRLGGPTVQRSWLR